MHGEYVLSVKKRQEHGIFEFLKFSVAQLSTSVVLPLILLLHLFWLQFIIQKIQSSGFWFEIPAPEDSTFLSPVIKYCDAQVSHRGRH